MILFLKEITSIIIKPLDIKDICKFRLINKKLNKLANSIILLEISKKRENNNNLEMIKILLKNFDNTILKDELGNTALIHASINKNVEMVRLLISKKFDPDIKNNDGKTAFNLIGFYKGYIILDDYDENEYTEILKLLKKGRKNLQKIISKNF